MEDLQAYMMRLFLEYAVSNFSNSLAGLDESAVLTFTSQRIAAKEGVDMDFHLNNDNWTQINSFERFSSPEDTLVDGGYSSHLTKMPLPDAKEEAPRHKAAVIMEEAKKDMDGMDGVKLEVWISGDDVAVDTTAGERK